MSTNDKLGDDFDENYDRFIAEALATGCVWGLESEAGWALCASNINSELDVLLLWSQPEFAQHHAADEWANYQVVPISLEELLDDWLPGLHEDITLVGANWNTDLEGDEIEPLDLLEDFTDAE